MTSRRSFLKRLFAGSVAAAVAPQIVTHGLKLVVPKTKEIALINPEWVKTYAAGLFTSSVAQYEATLFLDNSAWNALISKREWPENMGDTTRDPFPVRFVQENGVFRHINPFMIKRIPA